MQLGLFRSINLPVRRWLPPGKLSLPSFPSRFLRMLHPFPTCKRRRLTLPLSLQCFILRLQTLYQLLQSQNVDLQSLEVSSIPYQFRFQFGDPLIFRTGLGVLFPLVTHPAKFTASGLFRSESFALLFSEL
jgi:hypothetical protein